MRTIFIALSLILLPMCLMAQTETIYLDKYGDECGRHEAKYTRTCTTEKDGTYTVEKRLADGRKTLVVTAHVLSLDTPSYHGTYETYYEDGRKKSSGHYTYNKPDSTWSFYYADAEHLWYTMDYNKNELNNYYRSGKLKRHEIHSSLASGVDRVISGEGFDEAGNSIPFMPFIMLPRCPYSLIQYLSHNIHYPSYSRAHDEEGRVIIEFVVYEDGSINDVEVVRHVSRRLDKEARRVVAAMPPWIPGSRDGEISQISFKQPIVFKLED